MDVVEFGILDPERRAELEGDEDDPFDAARLSIELCWRPKQRHVALRDDTGRLVASAGLLTAALTVGGSPPLEVVGLGGVLVNREHRGRGLGDRIVREALRLAATLGPELILLFCHSDRAGLYRRHGFSEIADPVFVGHPGGWARMPMVSMWRPLRTDARLPPGEIRLDGYPF